MFQTTYPFNHSKGHDGTVTGHIFKRGNLTARSSFLCQGENWVLSGATIFLEQVPSVPLSSCSITVDSLPTWECLCRAQIPQLRLGLLGNRRWRRRRRRGSASEDCPSIISSAIQTANSLSTCPIQQSDQSIFTYLSITLCCLGCNYTLHFKPFEMLQGASSSRRQPPCPTIL